MKLQELRMAIYAGLLAGIIFLVTEMILTPLFTSDTAWTAPRLLAAIVMGRNVLPPPASFDLGIVMVGIVVCLAAASAYSVILALFIHLSNFTASVIVGIIYGLILYFINFNLLGSVFPWLAQSKNWIHFLANLIYGGTTGFLFKEFQQKMNRCEGC